jgi:alcohol dehydrogenase, propanol-preferring
VAAMSAYRLLAPGRTPEWCEVEIPAPRRGEVLVRIGGAGLCRTDLEIVDEHRCVLPFRGPFTLGHENAGWVESVGAGVTDLSPGEPVVVSTIKSCGSCRACARGFDNHCVTMSSRGLCEDGGLAPFMIADRRQLVPLGGLHPVQAAPLADAGLTAFAAANALALDADARIAVIGVGGLGALAVQIVRALAPRAYIVALDVDPERIDAALSLGADSGSLVDEADVDDLTGVLDFVGTDESLAWAARATHSPGAIVVCGRGGGVLPFSRQTVRPGVHVLSSRGGTIADLQRVVALAREGRIAVQVTTYPLPEVERAYADLRSGRIVGRTVVTFPDL